MQRALVVVEGDESTKQLVREAGELAAGVDAELLLVHVTTEEQFSESATSMADVPERDVGYGSKRAREGARQFAKDIGEEMFERIDVEFEAIGVLGDKEEEILNTARERDCDHIFITGRKRSPTGKAIFGDLAQSVLLKFYGTVTITTN